MRPFGCSVHLIEPGFHKTNIINPEHIVAALNRAWDQATPETKEEYGKQYLDKGTVRSKYIMLVSASSSSFISFGSESIRGTNTLNRS